MDSLRTQIQIMRINRTKRRVAEWWHKTHCPTCQAGSRHDGNPLAALFERLGVTGEEPAAPPPGKAH